MSGVVQTHSAVTADLQHEVERFLFAEALCIDERRWDDWIALLAPDIRYRMPTRLSVSSRDQAREIGADTDVALFDEDHTSLRQRVYRLGTGMAWAEDPPSRIRHLITNVFITETTDTELAVTSNFLIYRTRGKTSQDEFVGRRDDRLRRHEGSWQITERVVLLDQTVLLAKNLSVFF